MINRISDKTHNGIAFTLLKQESRKLAIILPGMGYTVQAPLLYYSTSLLFRKGYDVLHINYQYGQDFSNLSPGEQTEQIDKDVNEVINEVLLNHHYTEFTFIAKSIGTLALAALVNQERFQPAQTVWLTPLLTRDVVFDSMQNVSQKSLVIIGDKDHVYDEDRMNAVKENKNILTQVIAGVNHGLEFEDDIDQSIEVLKQVIKVTEPFISE